MTFFSWEIFSWEVAFLLEVNTQDFSMISAQHFLSMFLLTSVLSKINLQKTSTKMTGLFYFNFRNCYWYECLNPLKTNFGHNYLQLSLILLLSKSMPYASYHGSYNTTQIFMTMTKNRINFLCNCCNRKLIETE